ncbi:uncharacterized protein LOC131244100 [Magnolia sinica]|uniref:uncharacterized protein LOC131244100 n=1 Tax=Magnolia sinica TaxID=86752 RepID=UPI00265AED96|nr:uncharacterized protein LOC131244100 [Magnolia sinica]
MQLIELERQLQLEMESHNRVEKKLKLATRKLQSLKLSAVPSQSSSPEKSESSTSSSTVFSALQKQEEEQKAGSQTADSGEPSSTHPNCVCLWETKVVDIQPKIKPVYLSGG